MRKNLYSEGIELNRNSCEGIVPTPTITTTTTVVVQAGGWSGVCWGHASTSDCQGYGVQGLLYPAGHEWKWCERSTYSNLRVACIQ